VKQLGKRFIFPWLFLFFGDGVGMWSFIRGMNDHYQGVRWILVVHKDDELPFVKSEMDSGSS